MAHWTRKLLAVLVVGSLALAPGCGGEGDDGEEEEDSMGMVSSVPR